MDTEKIINTIRKGYELGPQIKKTGISDEVISRFKDLISRRVFTAGGRLPPERELALALGVSRPTLRQAMKALQILGVIRIRHGDASYLAESASNILKEPIEFALALKGISRKDLFETRQTLEVRLASLAAERRTEEDLQKMRDALGAMKDSVGVPVQWIRHEMRFHECIVQAARNEVITTVMEMLSRMLMDSRRETVQLLTNYEDSYQSHHMIYAEIERRDTVGASRAMVEHFAIMEAAHAPGRFIHGRPGAHFHQDRRRARRERCAGRGGACLDSAQFLSKGPDFVTPVILIRTDKRESNFAFCGVFKSSWLVDSVQRTTRTPSKRSASPALRRYEVQSGSSCDGQK